MKYVLEMTPEQYEIFIACMISARHSFRQIAAAPVSSIVTEHHRVRARNHVSFTETYPSLVTEVPE